jgi:D-arginine dehydrogenase
MGLCKLSKSWGAKYFFRENVIDVSKADLNWEIRTESNITIRANWVVNAAGAWVNSFLNPKDNLQVDAKAYARHLLLIEGWPLDFMPSKNPGFHWDERSNWYMRQWDKHSRLVSVCDQVPCIPEDFTANNSILEKTSETLLRELPQVAEHLSVASHWHCFRTYSEDKLPIWGEDENFPGLFWLAGFGGFGMSTSYAATEDAAMFIAGEKITITKDFLPKRVKFQALPKQKSALT